MSLFGHQPTFDETIEKLAEREGVPRYTNFIAEILSKAGDSEKGLAEAGSMDQFTNPEPSLDAETERTLEFIPQSIRINFSLIDWLILSERPSEAEILPTILSAVHTEIFRRQYLMGDKLRSLFSNLTDESGHDSEDEYLKDLRSKYGLSEAENEALQFKWVDLYAEVLDGLMEDELHIMPFEGDPVCFLVRNREKNSTFGVPKVFRMENGIIISKYFFLSSTLDVLCLLELLTKIIASEKNHDYAKTEIEIDELYAADRILKTARELSERIKEHSTHWLDRGS